MEIIYSGFDTIEFAVKGGLSAANLLLLETKKAQAVKDQSALLVSFEGGKRKAELSPNGMRGGYAYILSTGPLGEQIRFKNSLSQTDWNGFVKIRAASLAVYGWEAAFDRAMQSLHDMGFTPREISLNRIDYCMDFLGANFTLDPTHFVTHPRVKARAQDETMVRSIHVDKSAVAQSSTWSSVTLGKMPGRQVIIYDKRREVIDTHKPFWFKLWGIDKSDNALTVHRVEVRAGKKELQKFGIRNLCQFKAKIGDVFSHAVHVVRYVQPDDKQTNVSRLPLHPLWQHVTRHVATDLLAFHSYESPQNIREVFREQKLQEYEMQILGNIAGYAACLRDGPERLGSILPNVIREMTKKAVENDETGFWKTYNRAADRFVFLENM